MRLAWTRVCARLFGGAQGTLVNIAAYRKRRRPLIAFHVEHIVSRQHGGNDDPAGLALACDRCNAYKGPNITGIDPETGTLTALFHPRTDMWSDHFEMFEGHVIGVTPIGRATARLLNMNAPRRVELRREWLREV